MIEGPCEILFGSSEKNKQILSYLFDNSSASSFYSVKQQQTVETNLHRVFEWVGLQILQNDCFDVPLELVPSVLLSRPTTLKL